MLIICLQISGVGVGLSVRNRRRVVSSSSSICGSASDDWSLQLIGMISVAMNATTSAKAFPNVWYNTARSVTNVLESSSLDGAAISSMCEASRSTFGFDPGGHCVTMYLLQPVQCMSVAIIERVADVNDDDKQGGLGEHEYVVVHVVV